MGGSTIDPARPAQVDAGLSQRTPPAAPVNDAASGVIAAQTRAPAASSDPKVRDAVDDTLARASFPSPERRTGGTSEYAISETLKRTDLDQAQKDAYLAEVVRQARTNGDAETRQALAAGLDRVGRNQELGGQAADSVARLVRGNALGADDLHALVKGAEVNGDSAGARQLLGAIGDGAVLNNVANRLLTDARAELRAAGKDPSRAADEFTAAADVANMAAWHGSPAAARATTAAIAAAPKPEKGDLSLMQAMMADASAMNPPPAGRGGLQALTGLLDTASTTSNVGNRNTDIIFNELAKTGNGNLALGFRPEMNDATAGDFRRMADYFTANAGRIANQDFLQARNSDSPYGSMVRNFVSGVLLNPNIDAVSKATAVNGYGDAMTAAAARADNSGLNEGQRAAGAQVLGTLAGALRGGVADVVAAANKRSDAQVDAINSVAGLLVDKLSAPAGAVGGLGISNVRDAVVSSAKEARQEANQQRADDAAKPVNDLVNRMVDTMARLPESVRQLVTDFNNGYDTARGATVR